MHDLSPRQSEVAALVAEGFTGREIAEQLGISEQAVKNHKRSIYHKVGARNAVEMIRALMEKGSL
jgi:DNA-binding NarL/FixJ family response regulator